MIGRTPKQVERMTAGVVARQALGLSHKEATLVDACVSCMQEHNSYPIVTKKDPLIGYLLSRGMPHFCVECGTHKSAYLVALIENGPDWLAPWENKPRKWRGDPNKLIQKP